MKVQLTVSPRTTRPRKQPAQRTAALTQPSRVAANAPIADRLTAAVRDEQLCLAVGIFILVTGWIVINSEWSIQTLGLPLMLAGLLLPLVPYMVKKHAHRGRAGKPYVPCATKNAVVTSADRRKVYELLSTDHSYIR